MVDMSASLDQLIEQLQAVRDESAEAQKRVNHVRRVISVQELQLQKTKKQWPRRRGSSRLASRRLGSALNGQHIYLTSCTNLLQALAQVSFSDATEFGSRVAEQEGDLAIAKRLRRKSRVVSPSPVEFEEDGDEFVPATSKRTRDSEDTKPDASDKSYPAIIHYRFPTVIKYDDAWVEVSCHICSLNGSTNGGFFKGANGLQRHYYAHHTSSGTAKRNHGEVLAECTKRAVSVEDAAGMLKGQQPAHQPIVKVSETLDQNAAQDGEPTVLCGRTRRAAADEDAEEEAIAEKSIQQPAKAIVNAKRAMKDQMPVQRPAKRSAEIECKRGGEAGQYDAARDTIAALLKDHSSVDAFLPPTVSKQKCRHTTNPELSAKTVPTSSSTRPAGKRRRTVQWPDHADGPKSSTPIADAKDEHDEDA